MDTTEPTKTDGSDAADINQRLIFEPNKTQSAWFGMALLVIGVGMTLVWIGFVLWVLGNIIGYL